MKINNSNIKKAFTLAEIIVSFTILGVVSALTATSLVISMQKSKTETRIASTDFYNVASTAYIKATNPNSRTRFDITRDEADVLMNKMLEYFDFTKSNLSCDDEQHQGLKKVNFDSFEGDGNTCARLSSGIMMGVHIEPRCNLDLNVYEYLRKDDENIPPQERLTRRVSRACGYILYRTKNSQGIYKEDAFIIPLGKRMFK